MYKIVQITWTGRCLEGVEVGISLRNRNKNTNEWQESCCRALSSSFFGIAKAVFEQFFLKSCLVAHVSMCIIIDQTKIKYYKVLLYKIKYK